MDPLSVEKAKSWTQLRVYVWLLGALWTVTVATSLAWNTYGQRAETRKIALTEATIAFERTLTVARNDWKYVAEAGQ